MLAKTIEHALDIQRHRVAKLTELRAGLIEFAEAVSLHFPFVELVAGDFKQVAMLIVGQGSLDDLDCSQAVAKAETAVKCRETLKSLPLIFAPTGLNSWRRNYRDEQSGLL